MEKHDGKQQYENNYMRKQYETHNGNQYKNNMTKRKTLTTGVLGVESVFTTRVLYHLSNNHKQCMMLCNSLFEYDYRKQAL